MAMWRGNSPFKSEQGFTLVELLAVIVIATILLVLSGSFLVRAMTNYERISTEAMLRDEGEIIMAMLMKDLLGLQTTELIESPNCTGEAICSEAMIYKCKREGQTVSQIPIGFKEQTLHTSFGTYLVQNKQVVLNNDFKIEKEVIPRYPDDKQPNVKYKIVFALTNEKKNQTITFENSIMINNTGVTGASCRTK